MYLGNLVILRDFLYGPLQEEYWRLGVKWENLESVFSNILQLIPLCEIILTDLQNSEDETQPGSELLAMVFMKLHQPLIAMYSHYCGTFDRAMKELTNLRKNSVIAMKC